MGRWMVALLFVTVLSSFIAYVVLQPSATVLCLRDIARELLSPAAFQSFEEWPVYKEELPRGYQLVCVSDSEVHIGAPAHPHLPWYIFNRTAQSLQVRAMGRDGSPANGPAVLVAPDGSVTECPLVNDLCNGKGRALDIASLTYYDGEFQMGAKSGFGTFLKLSGRHVANDVVLSYSGEMRMGDFHGFGALKANNFTYVGEFRWGEVAGYGHMHRNGHRLTGKFLAGELHGFGCEEDQSFATCGVYTGGLRDGKVVQMNTRVGGEAKYLNYKDGVETLW